MLDVKEDVETLEDWVEVEQCNENDIVLVFARGGSVAVFARALSRIKFLRDSSVHPKLSVLLGGAIFIGKIDTILDSFKLLLLRVKTFLNTRAHALSISVKRVCSRGDFIYCDENGIQNVYI